MIVCNILRKVISAFILAFLLFQIIGCSTNRATYFRKYGADMEKERSEWAMCGGSFFNNGALKPIVSSKVYNCMKEKGYMLINDYYEEKLYSWLREDAKDEIFFKYDDLIKCGARRLKNGLCKHSAFILESEFSSVNKCMDKKGYILVPPRYKLGVRVFDSLSDVDGNFCLYLTPVNKKGGVSFGSSRME